MEYDMTPEQEDAEVNQEEDSICMTCIKWLTEECIPLSAKTKRDFKTNKHGGYDATDVVSCDNYVKE